MRAAFVEHGAQELMPIALADDATSLEKVVDPWLAETRSNIVKHPAFGDASALVQRHPAGNAEDLFILFGSQTGTAEAVARSFARTCEVSGIPARIAPLDAAVATLSASDHISVLRTVVIVCASESNGDIPDNSRKFLKWLRTARAVSQACRFCVLGIGDAQHASFGELPHTIDSRLAMLGATRFHRRGEADDNVGLHAAAETWFTSVLSAVRTKVPAADGNVFARQQQRLSNDVPTILLYDTNSQNLVDVAARVQRVALRVLHTMHFVLWPAAQLERLPPSWKSADYLFLCASGHRELECVQTLLRCGFLQQGCRCFLFASDTESEAARAIVRLGGVAHAGGGGSTYDTWALGVLQVLGCREQAFDSEVAMREIDSAFGRGDDHVPAARSSSGQKGSLEALKPMVLLHSSSRSERVPEGVSAVKAVADSYALDQATSSATFYKHVGWPRRALFVFVIGENDCAGIRQLSKDASHAAAEFEAAQTESTFMRESAPYSGLQFALLLVADSGGKFVQGLELEAALLAAGATKVHETALCAAGAEFSESASRWGKSLFDRVRQGGRLQPCTGYFDTNTLLSQWPRTAPPVRDVSASDVAVLSTVPVALLYTDRGRAKATATFFGKLTAEMGISTTVAPLKSSEDVCWKRLVIVIGPPLRRRLFARGSPPDALAGLLFSWLAIGPGDMELCVNEFTRRGAALAARPLAIDGLGQLEVVGKPWLKHCIGSMAGMTAASTRRIPEPVHTVSSLRTLRLVVLHCESPLTRSIGLDLYQEWRARGVASRVGSLADFRTLGTGSATHVVVVYQMSALGTPASAARLLRYLSSSELTASHFRGLQCAFLRLDGSGRDLVAVRFRELGAEAIAPDELIRTDASAATIAEQYTSWRNVLQGALQPIDAPGSTALENRLVVLFGSLSGHAEEVARTVAHAAENRGIQVTLAPLDAFDAARWKTCTALIVVTSTVADGAFPPNAQVFSRFLRHKSHPNDLLSEVRYCVLALGDSGYGPRFCAAGKSIDRRLEELGATRFYARTDADERLGYNSAVEPWLSNLWAALDTLGRGPLAKQATPDAVDVADVSMERSSTSHEEADVPFEAMLHDWKVMANDPLRPVTLMTFDVAGLSWSPGDAIRIMPTNREAECDKLARRLTVEPTAFFEPPDSSHRTSAAIYRRIQFPITYRDVLIKHTCLRVRNTNVLSVLLRSTRSVSERDLLKRLMLRGPEWSQLIREKTYIGEILAMLPACHPQFRDVIESLMPLQPRSYSLCSSFAADPSKMSICFRKAPRGVCTHWLLRLCRAHTMQRTISLRLTLRRGAEFKMPPTLDTPIIMIGPGTGVAPFVAFLQERQAQSVDQNIPCGESHLFFGCRRRDLDFLFADELNSFHRNGILHGLHVAFSQEPSGGVWYGGCYVQDKLLECSSHLAHLIVNRGAYVYVCGDADSMAHDVHTILADLIEESCQVTHEEAITQLDGMARSGRYQRDIWS
uniref:Methionine synthase reductase n=1 Tax=Neobodo designis TaxID=312471 RepID=A0A7S1R3Y3_NEODS